MSVGSSPQLLDRTFAILSLFTDERPIWTATEAARACGLPTPTAHRILHSLCAHGFVTQDGETKRFILGQEAIRLGDRAREHQRLAQRTRLRQPLERLSELTGAAAMIAAFDKRRRAAVWVGSADLTATALSPPPGVPTPLHAGAAQKLLLASLSESEVMHVLGRGLDQIATATITDPVALRLHLREIRARGWALSCEEIVPLAWAVAVPIRRHGRVVASLATASPLRSLSRGEVARRLAHLRGTAEQVGELLLTGAVAGARNRTMSRPSRASEPAELRELAA